MKSAASSVNEFLGRLLSTLSGAAWMPSFFLVVGLSFTAQLYSWRPSGEERVALSGTGEPDGPLKSAIDSFLSNPLPLYALGLLLVVVVAVFVQSFSYGSIRLLEGYWPASWRPVQCLMRIRVGRHSKVRQRLVDRQTELTGRLVAAFAEKVDPKTSGALAVKWSERQGCLRTAMVGGSVSKSLGDDDLAEMGDLEVHVIANEPLISRELEAIERRLKRYPEPDRVLPTNLGNCLRSWEDKATSALGAPMERVLHREHDDLPTSTKEEKDLLSEALRLHSSVTFAALFVFVISVVSVLRVDMQIVASHEAFWITPLFFLGLVAVSYAGALAAADDYGEMLLTAAEVLVEQEVESDASVASAIQPVEVVDEVAPRQLQLMA